MPTASNSAQAGDFRLVNDFADRAMGRLASRLFRCSVGCARHPTRGPSVARPGGVGFPRVGPPSIGDLEAGVQAHRGGGAISRVPFPAPPCGSHFWRPKAFFTRVPRVHGLDKRASPATWPHEVRRRPRSLRARPAPASESCPRCAAKTTASQPLCRLSVSSLDPAP